MSLGKSCWFSRMDDYVVLTVCYGGSCKLISVNSQSNYKDILSQIQDNWKHLSTETLCMRCSIGEVSSICLGSQADFVNMQLLCQISGVKLVSVEILESQTTSTSDDTVVPNTSLNNSILVGPRHISEHIHQSQVSVHSFNGIGSDYCKSPPLLSKGWADGLRMVVGARVIGNASDYRAALIRFSFVSGFQFYYRKNNCQRIVAFCREDKSAACPWYIKAKPDLGGESWVVYDVSPNHVCFDKLAFSPSDKCLAPKLIADLMKNNVRKKPSLNAKDVVDAMKIGYGVDIPYWKARRAANCAKDKLLGSFHESYDIISSYCQVLPSTNPGSVVSIQVNQSTSVFERVSVAFNSSLNGFRSYRPILFVDGTFLKGRVKGTLMVATAKDGNNGLFPVGFALVSAENTDNWEWFFTMLRDSVTHDKQISYLSDRNTGLVAALPVVFNNPSHFFCIFHLVTNLKGRFTGSSNKEICGIIVKLFKECAYAPTKEEFEARMEIFKEVGGASIDEWLMHLPFEKWALAYSSDLSRFGEMTSNAAESFNNWILAARTKPITQMFEHIRSGISRWIVERRVISKEWVGLLVPKKEAMWHSLAEIGTSWNVVPCPAGDYEVLSSPSVRVDLDARSCSCFQWQHTGFPCCHAVAIIKKVRTSVVKDIEECYFADNYRKCYSWDLNPVPESIVMDVWKKRVSPTVISPPILGRQPGHPKIQKRIPSYGEFSVKKKVSKFCHRCGIFTKHDDFTCSFLAKEAS